MAGRTYPPLHRGLLPTERLRPWMRGDPLEAEHFQEAVRAIESLSVAINAPRISTDEATEDGVVVECQRFVVNAEYGDYLACQKQGGVYGTDVSTEPVVFVAKPPQLRRTIWDGVERNGITYEYSSDNERTATDADSDTEDQEIVPSYVVGDEIIAMRGIAGGTGVQTAPQNGDPEQVEWQDINADGRAWAKV